MVVKMTTNLILTAATSPTKNTERLQDPHQVPTTTLTMMKIAIEYQFLLLSALSEVGDPGAPQSTLFQAHCYHRNQVHLWILIPQNFS